MTKRVRTPKQWLGSSASQQSKVDGIRALRLVTAIKTPYLPDGRIDLFAFDCLVEQQIEAGVEGLIIGARPPTRPRSRQTTPAALRRSPLPSQAAPPARAT